MPEWVEVVFRFLSSLFTGKNGLIQSKDLITSSATAEIDEGPCGASTLSSWRSESSNISLVVLDKLLF